MTKKKIDANPQTCLMNKHHRNARGSTPKKEERPLDGLPKESRQNNGGGSTGRLTQYES
ncbi:MAG: hypothetical protein KBC42_00845 [Candidatus Pacebacteria bacterium]|jgi:hypothetical protein|nr:hypothetical protein [Candidatus Paceibacterota bacterium]MBP9780456.1 hypothetical protein [Candidatus Paceibacterota bacterium]